MTEIDIHDRQLATLAHMSIAAVIFMGPLSILIPLVIWQSEKKKADHPLYLQFQAQQAFYYQAGVYAILVILSIVITILSLILIGFLLIPVLILLGIIAIGYAVYAGLQTWKGHAFRYWLIADFLDIPCN